MDNDFPPSEPEPIIIKSYTAAQLADEAIELALKGGEAEYPASNAFSYEFLTMANPPAMSAKVRRNYDRERARLGLGD